MGDQGSQGVFSPFLRSRRIRAALPFLRGRVLDFGCGAGALAAHVPPDRYAGVDRDAAALEEARRRFPHHRFLTELPAGELFDTIAALAVVEHMRDPAGWLEHLRSWLAPEGRIVLTTPHPAFRRIHETGARFGWFSQEAADEHEEMLDRAALVRVAAAASLRMTLYRRFLFGANQLAVLELSQG
ncbi:MAG: class I SAM-dependent methyltransferase [Bryobacteraceae bacterium]|jgi:2-polyprenyl-3-methyl-5-hydroxy-6-metoxy-1,4-benzoquinol methylase